MKPLTNDSDRKMLAVDLAEMLQKYEYDLGTGIGETTDADILPALPPFLAAVAHRSGASGDDSPADLPAAGKSRWQMSDEERLTAERDEARGEALRLRQALASLLTEFATSKRYDSEGHITYRADAREAHLTAVRDSLRVR